MHIGILRRLSRSQVHDECGLRRGRLLSAGLRSASDDRRFQSAIRHLPPRPWLGAGARQDARRVQFQTLGEALAPTRPGQAPVRLAPPSFSSPARPSETTILAIAAKAEGSFAEDRLLTSRRYQPGVRGATWNCLTSSAAQIAAAESALRRNTMTTEEYCAARISPDGWRRDRYCPCPKVLTLVPKVLTLVAGSRRISPSMNLCSIHITRAWRSLGSEVVRPG